MIKVVTIVGARPQFIKAAAISRAIANGFSGQVEELLVHTGQHYDQNMSEVIFDELELPRPKYNLGVAGGAHGEMTGKMLVAIEQVLIEQRPDWLLIYGDTNSTLAGALAAAKLHIPVAHVEAGLRSFNMKMPEEINRIVADRVSTLLFCPTQAAVDNLENESIRQGVKNVGDVMYDVALFSQERARQASTVLSRLSLVPGEFALATCHRAENTDDLQRLTAIFSGLAAVADRMPVVLPLHPRTRKRMEYHRLGFLLARLTVVEPLSFLDMIALEQAARLILTDSGGVQKEAFFYQVPCITMRDETEWVETVESGWNCLVGADAARIESAVEDVIRGVTSRASLAPYGDGNAAEKMLTCMLEA